MTKNRRQLSQLKTVQQSVFLLISFVASSVFSATIQVDALDDLQQAIDQSQVGDILLLAPGTYVGNFVISHSLTLTSLVSPFQSSSKHGLTTLDAQGNGNALVIQANDVTVSNLVLKNWGDDLTETTSGIKVKSASNVNIERNQLQGNGFGIYFEGVTDSSIDENEVTGNESYRSPDRGNGIHLTNVKHVMVTNNNVRHTRDGLYIINSQHNHLDQNTMTDLRFGIHYMYSHFNKVTNNHAERVDVGYALMSSQQLEIINNTGRYCEDYGLLLNFVNSSNFTSNKLQFISPSNGAAVTGDEGKALFVYNSSNNILTENRFENSDLGIHLTAGSEGNQIFGNQFINNEIQVKYVSTRLQEWSKDGQGNYWSNYLGWDLNQDGIGDSVFEPNDDVDKIIWKYPEAKILMDSPAVLLLRWVQRSFPVLKSPGVKDSYPLYSYTFDARQE
jgi:nitrous oxidase accessory protein